MKVRGIGRQPGAGVKFRLLMWKNFLQQWRHRWQTVAELLLPVATMTLVLILRSQIEPRVLNGVSWEAVPAAAISPTGGALLAVMNITQLSVAYSPQSDVLEDVCRSAMARLLIENANDLLPIIIEMIPDLPPGLIPQPLPDDFDLWPFYELLKQVVIVHAYNNSAELRGTYAEEEMTRVVLAAIEFRDELHGATELPDDLSYALRFPERPRVNTFLGFGVTSWRTDLVFPSFELPGPRSYSPIGGNDPGYVNEMFIALQHMISSELVSRVTGDDLRHFEVHLQRYPHPSYVEDFAVEILQFLFPTFIMLSFSYTAVNLVRAIVVEKELQLKETMKIMGLPTWLHWTAWFCKQFVYLLIAVVFIVIILKVNWFRNEYGFTEYAVFTNTPWTVLFFFIMMYLTCTIFFCFMLSCFFSKGSTAALFAGVIWFLTSVPSFLVALDIQMSTAVQVVTCLFLNSAMSYGFQLLLAREGTGGMQWGEFMFSPGTESSRFVFGHVVIMLAVDCVLYMLIALYFEQVLPGPYGSPKPWYFLFRKDFWFAKRRVSDEPDHSNSIASQDSVTKEPDPTDLPVGVKMQNLTKVYGSNTVVDNLNLNIYDDQITVLLGHNGAGKSTTISMLTGNLEVTRGSVFVAGYDMIRNTAAGRSHLGLCPQHNVLFNELTVKEHLEFFARLKGFNGKDLNDEIDTLIAKLELQPKRDYQAHGLSGGQKRRLSVGIALSGAARVVLLDEPTSGMDPASRRALWDLLQKEKKGRSLILTTHFMDEADILGDRVAIMANGRLQCVGSPYFLKRHYGVGYTLVVVKEEGFCADACTDIINKYIPATAVKEDRGTEVTYSLSNEYSHTFENMLLDLENNSANVKFKNYGLVATNMEDVFLSVGADVLPVNSDIDDAATTTTGSCSDDVLKYEFESSSEQLNSQKGSVTGFKLWWQHACAIWLKLWLVWSRSPALLLLQILVPILNINSTLGVMTYVMSLTNSIQRRALTLAQGFTGTETIISYNGTGTTSLGALATAAYEMMFSSANIASMEINVVNASMPLDQYYLSRTEEPSAMNALRNRLLTGATFSESAATAWFSNFGYHDVAVSLAAVHSALLKARSPNANLTVYNYPLEVNYEDQSDSNMMVQFLASQLSSGVGSSVGIVSAVFIMFYIKERVSRAKLLQKSAGIRPVTMWFSAAVFDWLWFIVVCLTIVISCVAFQVIGLSTAAELGRMYVCIMVYGAAMLPINYVFSYFFNGPAVGFVVMFFVNVLFGMMGSQIVEALQSPELSTEQVGNILDGILQFFPLYSLVTSVRMLNRIGLTEWACMTACDFLSAVTPNFECTMQNMCTVHDDCCVMENPHWQWDEPGVSRYIVCMLATGVVMWAVLMAAEYRLFQKVFNREKRPPPQDESALDADVVDEMRHVERMGAAGAALGGSSLVARGLSKYYKNHLAVNQVSFTVADGECFGLLGVNGAGKTSTFKMLMGDESISSGDAYVSGHSVKTEITKVHENIGYCPQFDAVFGELTGRQTLRFFSMLRAIPGDVAVARAELLADALGFTKHLDKRVDQYSGGNKRKLSTAVALLGRTRLVFVDEPTTGVDPAAKRQVWHAIGRAQRAGRGIVLTSHSMEECEALCSRLTIMVNGTFQCFGTPQHLKNKFSQGFTLTIKMKLEENVQPDSTPVESPIDLVKNFVNENFTNPTIMEEYMGLLTYYLPDRTMAWSRMFGIMERAKRELPVEDYSIAQTTLEQIFLQFTKYQGTKTDIEEHNARQPGAWVKFRLLMWKNFLQQWRHRRQTIAELLLPVFTMTLVLILRSQIEPKTLDAVTYPPISAGSVVWSRMVLSGMNITGFTLAFSPQSDLLEDVVRSALARFIVHNKDILLPMVIFLVPSQSPSNMYELLKPALQIQAYKNSAELRSIYVEEEMTRAVLAAVEFPDKLYGATELPDDLSYALRFPERPRQHSFFSIGGRSWHTDMVFPDYELPGPRFRFSWEGGNDPGYVNEMFIALQHVISCELVSRVTGDDLHKFEVHLQRFPHPKYMQDLTVEILQFLFPTFIMLSFSYTAVNLVRAIVVEKELQLKETMKIMGLPTWLHWTAWFWKQFIYLLIAAVFIVLILKVNWFKNKDGFSDYAVFTNTPWSVLFFFITLYLACAIFFCFMLSGFFSKGSTAALFAGVIWFLTLVPAFMLAMDVHMSTAVQVVTCLCINSAMSYGFQQLLARESTGGIQWGEFTFSPGTESSRFVFAHVVVMLVFDCGLYMLIALYLEQVLPGPYGSPKPWYFLFRREFWFPKSHESGDAINSDSGSFTKKTNRTVLPPAPVGVRMQKAFWFTTRRELGEDSNSDSNNSKDTVIKEPDPANLPVGVNMQNLTKVYGSNTVVDNLNLNIYDDQITVLLGHNGAGKSTTISMLTGNLKPTHGSVFVADHDMVGNSRAGRPNLGLCPQHNVLFNELTVKEHLEFFARLKGFSGKQLYNEIDSLISKLELEPKRDYQAHGLSGGQKRRLSVGIALSGAARVVLLDEPTSGMDPASRRALWDLLQKEKKGRSMILTTHFMDEADILGDRVAIMANGRLQCVGSPYFLKRHYGVGYTLVVVKEEGFCADKCTDTINKYIPATAVKEDRGTEVTYSLAHEYSHTFEDVLLDLENKKDDIRFKNYGLVATNMEDVFLSVGADVSPAHSDKYEAAATTADSGNEDVWKNELKPSPGQPSKQKGDVTGFPLWRQQTEATWLKLWLVWSRSPALLLLQLAVPVLMLATTLAVLNYVMSLADTLDRRALTLARGFKSTETLISYNGTGATSLGALAAAAYEGMFTSAKTASMAITTVDGDVNIEQYYLDRTTSPSAMNALRNRLLTGATFSESAATAWFSNFGYHDVAVSLAAVHSALLKARSPNANLIVYNHPLEANYRDQSNAQTITQFLASQLASGVGSSVGIISAVFIMFYIKERVSRAKLLQKAAGIRPVTMWFSAAVFDWLWFIVVCLTIVISCVAFNVTGLSTATELGRMYVCIMVYGAAMLPINYVFSHLFNGPAVGFVVMFFINVLFGNLGSQIVEALSKPELNTKSFASALDGILQFFPLYSLCTSIRHLHNIDLTVWVCETTCGYLLAVRPDHECTMRNLCNNYTHCCVREDPHWDWEDPGVLRYVVCMLATGGVMWAVLMAAEYRLVQKVFNRERRPPPQDESALDADVVDEMRHVERMGAAGAALGGSSLVARGLSKYYKNHLAVNQVSFTVADGECFGLLGVNGAGKTSTFKMLMGDESISSGDASVSGHSVKTEITKVHENIGYCPQFDAVFGELTGRQTLRFFSMLRAIPGDVAAARAELLADALGFTKHLDKRVDQYSGGNKRKLSTAVALLGRTRLVFVDEPTTGVDPAAKRQVWHAIGRAQRAGRGIVLTSHSMEECEALCSRLTIMVNGTFQCLGTPQYLKNKFSEGFTLTIKMKLDEDVPSDSTTGETPIDLVKNYVNGNFNNPKIVEEHQGLLTYYLPDRTMAWSRMFGIMERAKRELSVEDYSIAQTTLEQIFLQFTKYQGMKTVCLKLLSRCLLNQKREI